MSDNVLPTRCKLKGGTVSVFFRPGYHLVAHVGPDHSLTELARVTESLAFAQITAERFAKKFGAVYVPLMFG